MPSDNPSQDGFWLFGITFIGSPSSELFLALSGTVLLPIKTGFRKFYKRRFIKLIPPLVIWSVLGLLLYTQTHDLPFSDALQGILRIPFSQQSESIGSFTPWLDYIYWHHSYLPGLKELQKGR